MHLELQEQKRLDMFMEDTQVPMNSIGGWQNVLTEYWKTVAKIQRGPHACRRHFRAYMDSQFSLLATAGMGNVKTPAPITLSQHGQLGEMMETAVHLKGRRCYGLSISYQTLFWWVSQTSRTALKCKDTQEAKVTGVNFMSPRTPHALFVSWPNSHTKNIINGSVQNS